MSVKEELQDGYKNYARTTYFENGNDHIRISRYDGKKTYDRWFESGKREVEFIEDVGYIYYNEDGEKIRTVNWNAVKQLFTTKPINNTGFGLNRKVCVFL